MDPFSITLGVVTCVQILSRVSLRIENLFRAAEQVDTAVYNLKLQIDFLNNILGQLLPILKRLSEEGPEKTRREIWECAEISVKECESAINLIDVQLDRIRVSPNLALRALQMFKQDLSKSLNGLSSTLRTQAVHMQLTLQIISVMMSSGATPQLDRLVRMVEALHNRLPGDRSLEAIHRNETTDELRRVASTEVHTRQNTPAGSVQPTALIPISTTQNATQTAILRATQRAAQETPQRVNEEAAFDTAEQLDESSDGSEISNQPLRTNNNFYLRSWMAQNRARSSTEGDWYVSNPSSNDIQSISASTLFLRNAKEASRTKEKATPPGRIPFRTAKNILAQAERFFLLEEYKRAALWIRDGRLASKKLNGSEKDMLRPMDVALMYGICCVKIRNLDAAERELVDLVRIVDTDDPASVERAFRANYWLADINLRRRDLEAAEEYCQETLQERENASETQIEDEQLSCRLLALIYWAQNNETLAKEYAKNLTGEFAFDLADFREILAAEYPEENRPPSLSTETLDDNSDSQPKRSSAAGSEHLFVVNFPPSPTPRTPGSIIDEHPQNQHEEQERYYERAPPFTRQFSSSSHSTIGSLHRYASVFNLKPSGSTLIMSERGLSAREVAISPSGVLVAWLFGDRFRVYRLQLSGDNLSAARAYDSVGLSADAGWHNVLINGEFLAVRGSPGNLVFWHSKYPSKLIELSEVAKQRIRSARNMALSKAGLVALVCGSRLVLININPENPFGVTRDEDLVAEEGHSFCYATFSPSGRYLYAWSFLKKSRDRFYVYDCRSDSFEKTVHRYDTAHSGDQKVSLLSLGGLRGCVIQAPEKSPCKFSVAREAEGMSRKSQKRLEVSAQKDVFTSATCHNVSLITVERKGRFGKKCCIRERLIDGTRINHNPTDICDLESKVTEKSVMTVVSDEGTIVVLIVNIDGYVERVVGSRT